MIFSTTRGNFRESVNILEKAERECWYELYDQLSNTLNLNTMLDIDHESNGDILF